MATGKSLDDIVSGVAKLKDVASVKAYFMAVLSAQQKEIQKTKALVDDFRAIHNFENLYEKTGSFTALVDPVVNCEILHLRRMLRSKDEELRARNDAIDSRYFNPQSHVGQALLKKCRMFAAENEELGRILLEGQIQPLTLDLNKERESNKVLKNQVKGLHQYNVELEAEIELLSKQLSEQAQQIATLKKENDAMAVKVRSSHAAADSSPARKRSSQSPRRRVRDEKTHKSDRDSRYDKTARDEKSAKDDRDGRDERSRRSDRHEPDRRDSKHTTSRKDDKYEVDRKADRYDAAKKSDRSDAMKRAEKYESKKDDRRISSRKDEKPRREESHGRTPVKRVREDSRSRRSPYRRRSRSPRSRR
ncbi:Pre-mRNA-splicing regulator WTAP [Babesia bigemina]|uniref:Pre-mRNA-splicing regulator WTAP n=1 Tax=Babesia bigemina TaxID=5866 RepID=A0A061D253_BABBI|nr:Pre-mRNA-splicing regulator WTAP [Babesia bigemina]CDR94821.1 Pre-mRNA-splicing regulator WTAP [Babesia bigemina]|eukprot:XP_012767007.1 Pre-mRNA-splicing regulator WTAP [Babesia bigemina]